MVATDELLIQKNPGVMGGAACIRGMRIGVWQLVNMRRHGATENWILDNFEMLTTEDLEAAWDYYIAHTDEIETEIVRQEQDG